MHAKLRGALRAVSVLALAWSLPALAQEGRRPAEPEQSAAAGSASPGSAYVDNGDIIVTARKRQESILKVPVVVAVVSDQKIQATGITSVTELPKLVPGLVIAGNLLSIGPQVTIRGVGTSSYDPGVDQSVSLNVDGLSLSQGLAFGSAMFDVGQVEVMKGPQALFYGKSSPGGVIALRTADPGPDFEFITRLGYETQAREARGELILSGPVTDTLGSRFAAMYSTADGFFRNRAVPIVSTGATQPRLRESQPRNLVLRQTLVWEPTDSFSARFKANHVYDHAINAELSQLSSCPDGPGELYGFGGLGPSLGLSPVDPIPFIVGDDCKFDRNTRVVSMNPANFPGIPNRGEPYLQNKQNFGTLELNYDLASGLSLTSTTAYYKLNSRSLVNPTHTAAAAPLYGVVNTFHRREFTQELRLGSDFEGAFNSTLGGFFQDGQIFDRVRFVRNTAYNILPAAFLPFFSQDNSTTVNVKTYSLFGQARFKVSDQLELAGGVRWNDETRREILFNHLTQTDYTNQFGIGQTVLPRRRVHASNYSPEATITYTPTDDITVFASYKKGYKSGSFKLAVPAAPGEDNAFDDERVNGFEGGIKSRLFDRSLLANIAFYRYTYNGLQVGGIEPSVGGAPVIRTVNAGKARSYGVDFDLNYRPRSLDGLSVNGSVNWNKARYITLNNIPCYDAQTIADGCTQFLNPATGRFTAQDLSGTPMIRAPEWAANFGFDYDLPVGSDMKLSLSNNNQYSSKYVTFPAVGRPNMDNYQRSYLKVDVSLALKDVNDRWEVAVLGKNITDKLTSSNCSATNFAGGTVLGGPISGGTTRGGAGFAEVGCYPDGPGRTIWLRLTFKPFGKP